MNNTINILYVEDNIGDVELLKMSIERYAQSTDIVLQVVDTVEEANIAFNINQHTLALIDWNLPDGEGIDVVHWIREQHHDFPIILLSGMLTSQHISQANAYSPIVCLEKNYNKEFVDQIIQVHSSAKRIMAT